MSYYPPPGGGRHDPRMARDSRTPYGSFPPCPTTSPGMHSQIREHSLRGYNPNPWGDFPQQPFSSPHQRMVTPDMLGNQDTLQVPVWKENTEHTRPITYIPIQ